MIIKRFNTILGGANKTICKDNLIFNPAYLTDTEWVSKTDACPVLSVVAGDNTIEGLGSNTIVDIITDTTYELNSGVISFSTSGYVSYLELSNGSKYNFTGKNANDLTENALNLTITGTQIDLWSKSRALLKGDSRENVENIEKVKGTIIDNYCIYLNGTTSKASTTFTNDILYYLDNLTILYSEDGVILKTWETGDISVQGLLQIDLENRTLTIGFDGTNYKEMFLIGVVCEYNNSVELIKWFDITTSSGSEIEENNRTINENEWSGLAPFDDFSFAALDTTLTF